MLPNHAPLVVAEQFGMLEALHPGRIDLGIGRAPGTDQKTARALRRTEAGLSAENFPQELTELIKYFEGTADLNAVPATGNKPPMWLLGSVGLQRAGRGHARPAVRVRPPLQRPEHAAGAGALPAALPAVRGPQRAVRDGRAPR